MESTISSGFENVALIPDLNRNSGTQMLKFSCLNEFHNVLDELYASKNQGITTNDILEDFPHLVAFESANNWLNNNQIVEILNADPALTATVHSLKTGELVPAKPEEDISNNKKGFTTIKGETYDDRVLNQLPISTICGLPRPIDYGHRDDKERKFVVRKVGEQHYTSYVLGGIEFKLEAEYKGKKCIVIENLPD